MDGDTNDERIKGEMMLVLNDSGLGWQAGVGGGCMCLRSTLTYKTN